MITKVCKKCGIDKELSAFSKSSVNKYGVSTTCKECRNWEHRSDESKRLYLEKKQLSDGGRKRCAKCKEIKAIDSFRLAKNRPDGRRPYCIECENKLSQEHDGLPDIKEKRHNRDKTPESKKHRSEYRQTSEKFKATQEKFESSEKRKQWRLEYGRKLDVKVGKRLRTRVWEMIKKQGASKQYKFDEYLGCTVVFFMSYIESLWEDEMSWDNYTHSGWHLDHIRPCASFDLTDPAQQRQCFHYSNYQPLWAKDNFKKNSFYNGEQYFHKKAV